MIEVRAIEISVCPDYAPPLQRKFRLAQQSIETAWVNARESRLRPVLLAQ